MIANLWHMPEDGVQFQGDPLLRYEAWYVRVCMASVYLEGDYGNFLRGKIFSDDGYTPTGRKGARQVMHNFEKYELFCLIFTKSSLVFF